MHVLEMIVCLSFWLASPWEGVVHVDLQWFFQVLLDCWPTTYYCWAELGLDVQSALLAGADLISLSLS